MEFTAFTAGKDDEGKRLDKLVRAVLDGRAIPGRGPGMNIFQALRKRLVRLNGGKAEASARVHEGDRIEVASFLLAGAAGSREKQTVRPNPSLQTSTAKEAPQAPHPARSSMRLEVLFQNDDIMLINKPAGISVQPSSGGKESISQIVREEWEAAGPHGSLSFTPAPLHRLDRNTTGILAISRSARGAAWFSRAIRERSIRKIYIGICMGRLEEDALWEDWLAADSGSGGNRGTCFHTVRRAEAAVDGRKGRSSLARTQVHPVSHGYSGKNELTLVQYELLTGRKHQIRAQSALRGHPLYGDTAYGGLPRDAESRAGDDNPVGRSRGGNFFLHALRMEFPPDNPLSLPESVEAPLPEEFSAAMQFFPPQSLQNSTSGSIIYQ